MTYDFSFISYSSFLIQKNSSIPQISLEMSHIQLASAQLIWDLLKDGYVLIPKCLTDALGMHGINFFEEDIQIDVDIEGIMTNLCNNFSSSLSTGDLICPSIAISTFVCHFFSILDLITLIFQKYSQEAQIKIIYEKR